MSRSNIAGLARRAGRLPADDSPSVANGWGRYLLEHRPRENIFVAGDCNIAGLRVDTLAPLRRGSLGNGLSNRLCGASSATNHQFGATVNFSSSNSAIGSSALRVPSDWPVPVDRDECSLNSKQTHGHRERVAGSPSQIPSDTLRLIAGLSNSISLTLNLWDAIFRKR
jgi:hypothetical protein